MSLEEEIRTALLLKTSELAKKSSSPKDIRARFYSSSSKDIR
jgi:hypothetical protein